MIFLVKGGDGACSWLSRLVECYDRYRYPPKYALKSSLAEQIRVLEPLHETGIERGQEAFRFPPQGSEVEVDRVDRYGDIWVLPILTTPRRSQGHVPVCAWPRRGRILRPSLVCIEERKLDQEFPKTRPFCP